MSNPTSQLPAQLPAYDPPLYNPPPSAVTHAPHYVAPTSAIYPPALGDAKLGGLRDAATAHGTDFSKVDEERGLLQGAADDGQDGLHGSEGGDGSTLAARGDWRHTWRENKRLILIRIFCIIVILFALAGLVLGKSSQLACLTLGAAACLTSACFAGTITNRTDTAANPVPTRMIVDPLVP
ncbi:hypothetical protein JCM10908_001662 [Rhodotorula pacifica]|uniref:uncharacterized protein n=1 Tax=Rhodotorula pacifica TaxID=1495444 RepID=UPI003173CA8F